MRIDILKDPRATEANHWLLIVTVGGVSQATAFAGQRPYERNVEEMWNNTPQWFAPIELSTLTTKPAWSARCCCYNDHGSNSGRCTRRGIDGLTDPTRFEDQGAVCEQCRKECPCGYGRRVS